MNLCDKCPYKSQQPEVDVLRQACVDLGIRFVPPRLVNLKDAARLLGLEPKTLRNWISEGKLVPSLRISKRPLFSLEVLAPHRVSPN